MPSKSLSERTVVLWTAFWSKRLSWIPAYTAWWICGTTNYLLKSHSPTFWSQKRNLRNSSPYRYKKQIPRWSGDLSGVSLSSGSSFSCISYPTLWCDPLTLQGPRSILKSDLLALDSTTRVRAQQATTLYLPTLRMKQSWDRNWNGSSEVSVIKVQRKKLVPNIFLYQSSSS